MKIFSTVDTSPSGWLTVNITVYDPSTLLIVFFKLEIYERDSYF